MKRFFLFFTILFVSICTWAGNVITYTASSKLIETTDGDQYGLHTNAFNVPVRSHRFSNGTGTITFGGEVTSIGNSAFYDCTGLTSITIPNSVTSFGNKAFGYCSGLTSITIPDGVTSIGEWAFYKCSGLTSVTIPNSVTSIRAHAFSDCTGLTSITIPNSVTSIGESVFSGCSGLTSITIPNSVTSIGESAFSSCSGLTSVTIPNSVTSIGDYAFFLCTGLTSITIPNSVTSIDFFAFASCSGLTSVTIPNSVTSIGYGAFRNCSGLTSVTIPNSVTSIGQYAFANCSGLTSVTIECETPPSFGYDCFEGTAISKIYVPCGTLTVYKASSSTYAEYFSYPEGEYHLTLNWNKTLGRVDIISIPDTCNNEGTFSATPNSGYHFTQWSDGNTDNPRTIILTSDTTFTAEFAENERFTISVSAENGSVTGAGTYASGIEITLTATANYGYYFTQWSDGNTTNPRTIVVTEDATYTAEFAQNPEGSGYIVDYQNNVGTFSFTGNVEQSYVYYYSNYFRSTSIKLSSDFLSKDSDYNYVTVTPLQGGFQAGDTIMISGCINTADNTKYATVTFRYYLSEMESFFTTDYFWDGRDPIFPPLETFVLTQSCNALYLGRSGNTATHIIQLIVSRPANTNVPSELEHVEASNKSGDTPTKLVRNGQIFIQRGDRLYDMRGQQVK